jgi:hypothetical protein
MIVGKGQKSNKEYTAQDKELAFRQVISAVVKEEKRIAELKKASGDMVKETVEYWIEEYYETGDNKVDWTKEMKELFKIRIKESLKDDHTTRLAFERELIMKAEAGEGVPFND